MRLTTHQLFNLGVLLALFLLTGLYLWDAWRASTHVYNLIFVLPLTVSILVLCLATFLKELISSVGEGDETTDEVFDSQVESAESSTLSVVLLFVGYVLTLPWLGFDFGTFVFIALFLRLAGEKKWSWTLGYSLVFAFSSALFFSYMLPYPMPLLLLPGGN